VEEILKMNKEIFGTDLFIKSNLGITQIKQVISKNFHIENDLIFNENEFGCEKYNQHIGDNNLCVIYELSKEGDFSYKIDLELVRKPSVNEITDITSNHEIIIAVSNDFLNMKQSESYQMIANGRILKQIEIIQYNDDAYKIA
jgi:hypothetical protein